MPEVKMEIDFESLEENKLFVQGFFFTTSP
jgi:hypothetical protein